MLQSCRLSEALWTYRFSQKLPTSLEDMIGEVVQRKSMLASISHIGICSELVVFFKSIYLLSNCQSIAMISHGDDESQ
jgi:hypothetical protein